MASVSWGRTSRTSKRWQLQRERAGQKVWGTHFPGFQQAEVIPGLCRVILSRPSGPFPHAQHLLSGGPKCHLSPLDKQSCIVHWLFPWKSTTAPLKSLQPPVQGLSLAQVCCCLENSLHSQKYNSSAGIKLSVCLLCWAPVWSLFY